MKLPGALPKNPRGGPREAVLMELSNAPQEGVFREAP